MPIPEKSSLEITQVQSVVRRLFGSDGSGVMYLNRGNSSSVFSLSHGGKDYVIKFSDSLEAYETEPIISKILSTQGIPYPKCIAIGKYEKMNYIISERISGQPLANCSYYKKLLILPELIQILSRMNHIELGNTHGYGWITKSTGNGRFNSWKEFITAFFAKEQLGYWEGWHNLFETTCLEKSVFNECFDRLMAYAKYNEPHRAFIHGDLHLENILTKGQRITGIIDGNSMYGDFLIDLVTLDKYMKGFDVIQPYLDYHEQLGNVIPNFKERIIGAKYFIGLHDLRLLPKIGREESYYKLRDELLNLTNEQ